MSVALFFEPFGLTFANLSSFCRIARVTPFETVGVVQRTISQDGIMRLRGSEHVFTTAGGYSVPLIPLLHPAYLLRRPQEKSRAWRDLLLVEQRLGELGG